MPRQYTPRVELACRNCNAQFWVIPARLRAGKPRYCSTACWKKHRASLFAERFWAKVVKTDSCWLWTGAKDGRGYGYFYFAPGDTRQAHRVSWEIANGPIPDGLCVLHNCPGGDNPSCVNPSHLFLGDRIVNNEDKVAKDRQTRGTSHPNAKLNEAAVVSIRRRYALGGISLADLAAEHNVRLTAIHAVVQRRSWRHVP